MHPDVVTGIADHRDFGGGAAGPIGVGGGQLGPKPTDESRTADSAGQCGNSHARIFAGDFELGETSGRRLTDCVPTRGTNLGNSRKSSLLNVIIGTYLPDMSVSHLTYVNDTGVILPSSTSELSAKQR